MQDIKDKANAVSRYQEKPPAEKKEIRKAGAEPENTEEEGTVKHSLAARILAVIALLIFLGLIIWLIVCIVTESQYTLAVIFCVIIYPILLYVMFWLKKVFSR